MISMHDIIKAEGITVGYKEKEVLRNLNLSIQRGKTYGIIGPNGSGKTTLLRTLARNIKPRSGKVLLDGDNMAHLKNKDIAKKMAVLSQLHGSDTDVSVKNLVTYGRYAYKEWWQGSSEESARIVDWAIERTHMQSFAHRKMCHLSGGERQRAWIAMAIAQKPDILLLDEPTTFLDMSHQLEVLELLHSLNKENGMTIVMVLHDINQAAIYSDELIVLKDGDIYQQGQPEEIINEKILEDVFRIHAEISRDKVSGKPVFHPRLIRHQ